MWHDEDDADRNGRLKKPQKVENNVQYNDSMDNKCNLQQIKSSVGVIKSNWYNKSNQKKILLSQTYGTAFAISPQKLLTCTHNIYSQYKQKFASQIQFCPAIAKGYVKKQQYIVEKQLEYNKNIFSLFHYYENCNKNFDAKPQEDQICIIYLSGQLKIKQYIQIGQLDRKTIDLQIFGYPSEDYKTQSFINANINRLHLKGCLERIEDDVIHHTLETKTGCSGAPILAKANKTYYAVGIHTHRGMGNAHYNSGVYFSQKILKRIEDLEFCISVRWNLKPDIQYINNKSGCQSLSPSNPAQQFQDFNEFEKQNIFQIKQAINLQQNDQIPKQQQQKQKILMLQIKNQQNNSSNSSNNFSIIQKNMPISQQKMKCQQIQQQSIQLDQIISKIKQNFMIQEQIDRYNLCQRRQYKIQEYQDDSYSHSIINDSFLRDQQGLFSSDQSVSNRSIIDFKDIIDYFSQFKTESQEYQTSQCSSNNKIPQYIFNCYQMYIIPRIFIKKIILLSFRMLTIIIS